MAKNERASDDEKSECEARMYNSIRKDRLVSFCISTLHPIVNYIFCKVQFGAVFFLFCCSSRCQYLSLFRSYLFISIIVFHVGGSFFSSRSFVCLCVDDGCLLLLVFTFAAVAATTILIYVWMCTLCVCARKIYDSQMNYRRRNT